MAGVKGGDGDDSGGGAGVRRMLMTVVALAQVDEVNRWRCRHRLMVVALSGSVEVDGCLGRRPGAG